MRQQGPDLAGDRLASWLMIPLVPRSVCRPVERYTALCVEIGCYGVLRRGSPYLCMICIQSLYALLMMCIVYQFLLFRASRSSAVIIRFTRTSR
jgi:hypothetical protein